MSVNLQNKLERSRKTQVNKWRVRSDLEEADEVLVERLARGESHDDEAEQQPQPIHLLKRKRIISTFLTLDIH